jgi:hypothetical protein
LIHGCANALDAALGRGLGVGRHQGQDAPPSRCKIQEVVVAHVAVPQWDPELVLALRLRRQGLQAQQDGGAPALAREVELHPFN